MSEIPKIGDRVRIHYPHKDVCGRDILDRNFRCGYGNTIRNIDKYKRTGMIVKIIATDGPRIYRAEIILDEKEGKPVTCRSKDRNRIDGRLELWANEFSLLEVDNANTP